MEENNGRDGFVARIILVVRYDFDVYRLGLLNRAGGIRPEMWRAVFVMALAAPAEQSYESKYYKNHCYN